MILLASFWNSEFRYNRATPNKRYQYIGTYFLAKARRRVHRQKNFQTHTHFEKTTFLESEIISLKLKNIVLKSTIVLDN